MKQYGRGEKCHAVTVKNESFFETSNKANKIDLMGDGEEKRL